MFKDTRLIVQRSFSCKSFDDYLSLDLVDFQECYWENLLLH